MEGDVRRLPRGAGRARRGASSSPFDLDADYREYVDGKKREDGVRSFLDSRGIELPEGIPDDRPDAETVTASATARTTRS